MTLYSMALFLHVVGALGFFVALSFEWVAQSQLRRATTAEQAREWLKLYAVLPWVGGPAMVLILLLGLYMLFATWGGVAWAMVALAAMIVYSTLAGIMNGRRIPALRRAVDVEQRVTSDALRRLLLDPRPWTLLQLRTGLALGIVFLMTVKPDLVGSLIAIGASAVLGLATGLPNWTHSRAHQPAA
jgi:hypothetical protein